MKKKNQLITRILLTAIPSCFCLLLCINACGPVSGMTHIMRASVSLETAKTAGADKYAVYEYESAKLYLQKAKEEYGYSDFITADEYAITANSFAQKAISIAETSAETQKP